MYNAFIQYASKKGKMSLEEAQLFFPTNLKHTFYFYYYYVNELLMF